jgi:hypothetical protein
MVEDEFDTCRESGALVGEPSGPALPAPVEPFEPVVLSEGFGRIEFRPSFLFLRYLPRMAIFHTKTLSQISALS